MATATDNTFLVQAATYLGATAIAVPIFKRLKLGTILGFLAAGIVLGPSVLGLLSVGEGVFHIAELGVVLFLFVIGLELSLSKLWSLKNTIFGLGLLQMSITGLAIGYGFYATGILALAPALVAGFALACSSTAFALSLLEERRELNQPHGVKSFSILLFQDLAVIPLLASIPFVAMQMSGDGDALSFEWWAFVRAAAVILLIVIPGRYILDYTFKIVAVSGSREAFAAMALFVVAAVSLAMDQVGLSMALGGFIAGVLLAESAFRHQIETDIQPFRELLLGLFFIGVGMQLDLSVVAASWAIVLFGAIGLIVFKSAVIYVLARLFRSSHGVSLKAAATLCQGGEFGFVVFSLGAGAGVFEPALATLLSAIITLTMMATPLAVMAVARLTARRADAAIDPDEDVKKGRVLVIGYGRIGQLVTQILRNSGVEVTAIDADANRIKLAAKFGNKVYFGDGTNIAFLRQAGAFTADAVVFAISDRERLRGAVEGLREHCPNLKILVRVYDRLHELEMMDLNADYMIREMYESSITMAGRALEYLGFTDQVISDIQQEYRARDRSRLLAQRADGLYAQKESLHRPFDAVREDDGAAEDDVSAAGTAS